jgi:hypothetical protein
MKINEGNFDQTTDGVEFLLNSFADVTETSRNGS